MSRGVAQVVEKLLGKSLIASHQVKFIDKLSAGTQNQPARAE
jgi:hypothetical protein